MDKFFDALINLLVDEFLQARLQLADPILDHPLHDPLLLHQVVQVIEGEPGSLLLSFSLTHLAVSISDGKVTTKKDLTVDKFFQFSQEYLSFSSKMLLIKEKELPNDGIGKWVRKVSNNKKAPAMQVA